VTHGDHGDGSEGRCRQSESSAVDLTAENVQDRDDAGRGDGAQDPTYQRGPPGIHVRDEGDALQQAAADREVKQAQNG